MNSEAYKYDVFLSYSSRDGDEVEELATKLRADNFAVWLDRWIVPLGGNIYHKVVEGVQTSRFLLQVLSPRGLGSEWAAAEREIVLIDDPRNGKERFIPLLLEDVELPPDLRRFRYLDFRRSRDVAYQMLHEHFAAARKATRQQSQTERKTAAVFRGGAAPLTPPHLFGRKEDFETVCKRLVGASKGKSAVTAIYGWPGVGKTALASGVAHADRVRNAFPDGVLWATVGSNPDFGEILRLWASARGVNVGSDAASVDIRLHEHLSDKRVLVVLDDVWLAGTSRLMVAGPLGATLITTRAPAIAHLFVSSDENLLRLGVLKAPDALDLLRDIAPAVVNHSPTLSSELCAKLEYLPLAVKVAGRLLRVSAELNTSFGVEELFKELGERQRLLDESPPGDVPLPGGEISQTVGALFVTSIHHLSEVMKNRFLKLATLAPAPAIFSQDHASVAMVVRGSDLTRTLGSFYDAGLIESINDSRYWIHSMLVATARWMRDE